MKQVHLYRYLGQNGVLDSLIYLEGVPHVLRYRLIADKDKMLTNGYKKVSVVDVNADDVEQWWEIEV